MKIISGNLLESKEKYIAHQCNCVSTYAAGLAKQIFDEFPYANIYKKRLLSGKVDGMGNIIVCGDGETKRYVINMLAQFYPGKPKYQNSKKDGYLAREKAFADCLTQISAISEIKSIAFPYNIGCNLAGGDWETYYNMIESFEKQIDADVVIYKWSE